MLYGHSMHSYSIQRSTFVKTQIIYFIISMLLCIYIKYFCPISHGKEGDDESPKPQSDKETQQGKQKKYHWIFSMHRDLVSLHQKKTPCSTYCLHLTTCGGPVCPVYCQALSDGRTGFE